MTITLWKGYHGEELSALIASAWDSEQLLILCPPMLQDFSFLAALPAGDLVLRGAWTEIETSALFAVRRAGATLPFVPVLGVFTSGTMSSTPRLVLYSKANVRAALDGIFSLFDTSRINHVFCYPQAFHTFGLTLGYLAAHVFGWRLHTPHGKYQRASHEDRLALRESNVLTLGTPTHFFDLLQVVKSGREIVPSYTCIMGGAGVSRELWHSVRSDLKIAAPSIGYGCTEAAPGISHLAPGVAPLVDDEIGQPLSSLRSVLSAEGVRIDGASLCKAIIQNGQIEFPEQLLIRDLISTNQDGSWVYGGRLDLTLNRGGQKFSLEAIERHLQVGMRTMVVASTVRDTRLGEDLGLALMLNGARDEALNLAQDLLMRDFGLRLDAGKIKFVDEFPLNESSKLDRRAVRKMFEVLP